MSAVYSNPEGNPTSTQDAGVSSPEQIAALLAQFCAKLRYSVTHAVEQGTSFDQVERKIWDIVWTIGFQAIELFVKLQGIGDLGTEIAREDAQPLLRSDQPVTTIVCSIFGHHRFEQFSYSTGQNRKVELYPINARLQLPENQWSYLLQEFSQLFCVDQSFNQAAKSLESIWKKTWGHDTFMWGSRFPAPRFEIISVRTAREIGPACLFRFKSFEISADNHLCRRFYNETHFRTGRRERC